MTTLDGDSLERATAKKLQWLATAAGRSVHGCELIVVGGKQMRPRCNTRCPHDLGHAGLCADGVDRSQVTECQRAYLDAIRVRGSAGEGFAEVELLWASSTNIPTRLEAATAVRVFDALVRKGYATHNEYGGPILTEAGEAIVGRMRSREGA